MKFFTVNSKDSVEEIKFFYGPFSVPLLYALWKDYHFNFLSFSSYSVASHRNYYFSFTHFQSAICVHSGCRGKSAYSENFILIKKWLNELSSFKVFCYSRKTLYFFFLLHFPNSFVLQCVAQLILERQRRELRVVSNCTHILEIRTRKNERITHKNSGNGGIFLTIIFDNILCVRQLN